MLPWTPPDPVSLALFVAIVLAVCVAVVAGIAAASEREHRVRNSALTAAGLAAWMALHAGISTQLEEFMPVSFVLNLALIVGATLVFAFTRPGTLLAQLPLWALVGFSSFRLPLELILHAWVDQGVIPESMTWTGQNIDIVAGVAAILGAGAILALPRRQAAIALVVNTLNLALLINVIRVALQSAPLPIRVFGDPVLVLPLHVPTTWIVSILVAGALASHVIVYRAIQARSWTASRTSSEPSGTVRTAGS